MRPPGVAQLVTDTLLGVVSRWEHTNSTPDVSLCRFSYSHRTRNFSQIQVEIVGGFGEPLRRHFDPVNPVVPVLMQPDLRTPVEGQPVAYWRVVFVQGVSDVVLQGAWVVCAALGSNVECQVH